MKRTTAYFLVFFLLGLPLTAGTLYRIESRDSGSDRPETIEMTVEGGNLRMDVGSGSDGTMIFRGASEEMIVLDHGERSFVVMDKETVERLAGTLGEAMRQMEAALANVPAEQRAMVEEMMQKQMGAMGAGAPAAKPEVRDTGQSGEVNGTSCRWKEVSRDGELDLKLCVGAWDQVEGADDLVAAFQGLESFYSSMMDALRSAGGPLAGMTSGLEDSFMSEMMIGEGFPLMTEDWDRGRKVSSSRYLGSESVATSDQDFAPPAGYRRTEIPTASR